MKILLVGAGGYASEYVKILLTMNDPSLIWEGIVDQYYANCEKKRR